MTLLVLSDIHANLFALRAVLEAAPARDEILCLGDIVGYGAQPNECCELLRGHSAICLGGNHDAAIGGHELTTRMNALAQASNEWTRGVLTLENCDWLATLPPHRTFEEWGGEAVHASLDSPLEGYIQGIISARPSWKAMRYDVCFFGHTHVAASLSQLDVPGHRYETRDQKWRDGGRFVVPDQGWKTLVNPGSVGQPRDGNPLARHALFDTQTREVEISAVSYDVEAAIQSVLEAGFGHKVAERLALGR